MVAVIQLTDIATVKMMDGINQVSRENGKRRVIVTANVEGRDLGSFVTEVQSQLKQYPLPSGYWIEYGGQFENLASATGSNADCDSTGITDHLYFADGCFP